MTRMDRIRKCIFDIGEYVFDRAQGRGALVGGLVGFVFGFLAMTALYAPTVGLLAYLAEDDFSLFAGRVLGAGLGMGLFCAIVLGRYGVISKPKR